MSGWDAFWTRQPGVGELALDTQVQHGGSASARIEHRGEEDWSFSSTVRLPVQPGDLFELEGWVKLQGAGDVIVSVITYDAEAKTVDWVYGESTARGSGDWRRLQSRFVIPPGVISIQPRLIGHGPLTVWADDLSLRCAGQVTELRRRNLPPVVALSNATLVLTLETTNATFSVFDRRTGQNWAQQILVPDLIVQDVRPGEELEVDLLQLRSGLQLRATLVLDGDLPEVALRLSATGPMNAPLQFPHPFVTQAGTWLVLPMNEGISYPVTDETIEPTRLVTYGGHGLCMGFWGVTDGDRWQMAIVETPDDAAVRVERRSGLLRLAPEWDPQRARFGYTRQLRYVVGDCGGHTAMAKRYRAYAQQQGLLKTLAAKRAANASVDLLVGAVNVWCWEREPLALVREMKSLGIDRILWSNQQTPENLRALNGLGVLTSRYDIYQDVMDPANFQFLRGSHPDWTTEAWPDEIIWKADGNWLRGWAVQGRNGQWYSCGVICDRRALGYAARRIPPELETHPYHCRFIDTTTAAPWHECYHPEHPMTRTQSRESKMALLRYVSDKTKLVTGSETGHDAAVPYVHYFEGMLSLGPYRVPDAGRDMQRIWDDVPAKVAQFQLGQRYRLPLWELVYHDCVVAQWYWGDYNNKLPALWDKRDLFNLLYGTPPMFMFNTQLWTRNKARFAQSYTNVCLVARATGYAEMLEHRFLTPDRDVQQTRFANGVAVTVNFSEKPHRTGDGAEIAGGGFRVLGLRPGAAE